MGSRWSRSPRSSSTVYAAGITISDSSVTFAPVSVGGYAGKVVALHDERWQDPQSMIAGGQRTSPSAAEAEARKLGFEGVAIASTTAESTSIGVKTICPKASTSSPRICSYQSGIC